MASIAEAGGPTNTIQALSLAAANAGFSERKP
jgi:hypothetical protein